MRAKPGRIALIHGSLVLFLLVLFFMEAKVQLWQRHEWQQRARRQHRSAADLPARRGMIADVNGIPLAETRELVRLNVAPREIADRRALARELGRLRVSRNWIARAIDTSRAWVSLPGRFLQSDASAVMALRGVHSEPALDRTYTARAATRRVIGRVDADGRASDGLELVLDSLLRGEDGHATRLRDSRGRLVESPQDDSVASQPGDDVVLTISQELQEISERALGDAMERLGASGGDIVVLDPSSGEIRAMASRRAASVSVSGLPALTEPFEPGSTIKPFLAAALLTRGLARPDEMVNTENGSWTFAVGAKHRTVTDEHRAAQLSLADVIRWSSNIGMMKFASRLTHGDEYETLRDLGFGTPTGVPYPSEATGTLRPPREWSLLSASQLAIGYELSVTPLQLALAYATLANGGELLEPTLIKEVHANDGTVLYKHERRVVRRVMDERVAATVRSMLEGVVEGGTAKAAGLGSFPVAGKTGTARRTTGTRYVTGDYTATFVGLFPVEHPQYVILVKIDTPRGEYLAGKVAAPISKVVLQAAIAARDASLDRRALAASESLSRSASARDTGRDTARDDTLVTAMAPPRRDTAVMPPVTLALPVAAAVATLPLTPRAVPDVHGLPLRAAVRALHAAGFRVQVSGSGAATSTWPSAGMVMRAGTVVRVVGGA
jgi:cell division protein FtsI (penicillin-binding protein 3)